MRASRGEIKIEEILTEAGLNFKEEYSFPGLVSTNGRALRFDFAVFDDNGEYCQKHDITLIAIPYWDEGKIDYDYIMRAAGY